jgi:hypothetical protein
VKRFLAAITLFASTTTVFAAPDILQSLGTTRAAVTSEIVSSLISGGVYFEPVRTAFRKASPAARTAMVEQALTWTKAFVTSPEFDKLYAAARAEAKPQPPESSAPKTAEEELARLDADMAANLAEMKKNLGQVPAEMRKEMEKSIKQAEADWNKQKKDPRFLASLKEQVASEGEGDQQGYKEELQRWNEEYPANGRTLVAKRLREFLAESNGVAYDAKLVRSGSKMRFADAKYEEKSSEWKMCFRGGKEPVEKARAFAQAWLAEMK